MEYKDRNSRKEKKSRNMHEICPRMRKANND